MADGSLPYAHNGGDAGTVPQGLENNTPNDNARAAAVYRHINAAGETVYIGCAVDPYRRFAAHASQSQWALDVVRVDIMWFPSREEALAEEARLIALEKPRFNGINARKQRIRKGGSAHLHVMAAIEHHGSQAKLAKAMGCTQQRISQMLKEKAVNARMAVLIEVATGGKVSRHDLCPDVFGAAA